MHLDPNHQTPHLIVLDDLAKQGSLLAGQGVGVAGWRGHGSPILRRTGSPTAGTVPIRSFLGLVGDGVPPLIMQRSIRPLPASLAQARTRHG